MQYRVSYERVDGTPIEYDWTSDLSEAIDDLCNALGDALRNGSVDFASDPLLDSFEYKG